ncbi:MAG: SDR family oxidoreductase [Actinobacteria bacterium]|nr:SDR family oxidoreductase [Thermoleophilia bacterium]MCB9011832.1 SDR family oxidoreductase [Actinomycetota bacterium]
MKVRGKVIVVTGGGNGIGREVVLELLRRDARVAAIDVRQASLDETASIAAAGDRLLTLECDLTDRAAVQALPDRIVDALGPVDGLVNVAGIIQPFVRLAELDYDTIERVMAVNFWGTVHTVKTFLPGLLQRPTAHISNVSSMGGFLPVPGQTAYGASKAAVKLLSEGLYAELLGTPVGVSVVMPGAVATDIASNSGVGAPAGVDAADAPKFPSTAPTDAARIIVDGIEDNRLHVFVGRDSRMMDVARRIAPKGATRLIYRKMRSLLDA